MMLEGTRGLKTMPSKFSVAIIDHDKRSRNALMTALLPYSGNMVMAGAVDNFRDGVTMLNDFAPDAVFLGVADLQQGVESVRFLTRWHPRVSVIASSFEENSEWILALMRAGAAEYLLNPFTQEDLQSTIQKVARFLVEPTPREMQTSGKIISVYNPIGGTGTTTLAVNLAAALSTNASKVALVDLNLDAGDVGTFLNIKPAYNLSSLTTNIERLDHNFLMSVMIRHPSGPFVLTDAQEFDETLSITPERVHRVLNMLKGIFDYVVVDSVGLFAGCNVPILHNSSLILLTATFDKPSLTNVKRNLIRLERMGVNPESVRLVINRYIPALDSDIDDFKKMIMSRVFQVIPNEYKDVVESINKGMPVVKLLPRSRVSIAIMELARNVELALNRHAWHEVKNSVNA
jgi:pilus assembly protein CpaE